VKPVVPPFVTKDGFGTLGLDFDQPGLPLEVSLCPATAGAWLTLLFLTALVLMGVYLGVRHYRRRAPRRKALRELELLQKQPEPQALETLLVLLKALALESFGRKRVASLSGARWRAFLMKSAPNAGFEGAAGEVLLTIGEQGPALVDAAARKALFVASGHWIRQHRSFEPAPAAPSLAAKVTQQASPPRPSAASSQGASTPGRGASHD